MKLVLVNNKDILITDEFETVIGELDVISIDTKFVEEADLYTTHIAYNNGKYEQVKDGRTQIPSSLFKELNVIIRVKLVKKTNQEEIYFESDNLPIAKYISFGPYIQEAYPQVISNLIGRISRLEKEVRILRNEGDLF